MTALDPADVRHGTYHAYNGLKCRCDECRRANATYARGLRRRNGLAPSHAALNYARNIAATWVRENRPDVWQQLVDQAYARQGVDRQPIGQTRRQESRRQGGRETTSEARRQEGAVGRSTVDLRERWHGTVGGYNNHYCRCDDCKAAKAAALRAYRRTPEYRKWNRERARIWRAARKATP